MHNRNKTPLVLEKFDILHTQKETLESLPLLKTFAQLGHPVV